MQIRDRITISKYLDEIAKKLPDDENVKEIRKFVEIHQGMIEINGVDTKVTYCDSDSNDDWSEYIINDEVYMTGYKNIKPIRK